MYACILHVKNKFYKTVLNSFKIYFKINTYSLSSELTIFTMIRLKVGFDLN